MKPRRRRLEFLAAILGVLHRRNLGALETIDFRHRIIWIRHVKSDCRIGFPYRYDPRARRLAFADCEIPVPALKAFASTTLNKKPQT